MSGTWTEKSKVWQQPYDDWALRREPVTEMRETGGAWRSVSIRITESGLTFLKILEQLRDYFKRRQFSVAGGSFERQVEIADEEFVFLDELARGLGDQVDDIKDDDDPDFSFIDKAYHRLFFVYMREELIEAEIPGFLARDAYEIAFVSPRIPSLNDTQKSNEVVSPDIAFASETGVPKPIYGIIDDGIAFAHENFRTRDGEETRIEWLWVQSREVRPSASPSSHVLLGHKLSKSEIDALLQKHDRDQDIYREAGVLDMGSKTFQPLAYRASHGTHVLDLMAGFDPEGSIAASPDAGDADRGSPIFAVQLPPQATEDTSGETMGSYVLQAVRQLMVWADLKQIAATREANLNGTSVPDLNTLIINFSYGILAGPKDGTQRLEKLIDELIEARRESGRPTYIVLPSGNSYDSRTTAVMDLEPGDDDFVDWIIHPDDRTSSFLEVWTDSADVVLSLQPPGADDVGMSLSTNTDDHADQKVTVLEIAGGPTASIVDDLRGERRRIFIAVGPTKPEDGSPAAPSGAWRVSLANHGERTFVSLYIQRDDTPAGFTQRGRQSHFEHPNAFHRDPKSGDYLYSTDPITNAESLSAIATGNNTVVVGAATDTPSPWDPPGSPKGPSTYTSSGPTPNRKGPDTAAIADVSVTVPGVLAAGTYSGSVMSISGTSVAAPQVARTIAPACAVSAEVGRETDLDPRLGRGLTDERRLDKVLRGRY